MSDSDSSVKQKDVKNDYVLKPSKEKAKLNSDNWPLLLKNFD